MVFWGIGAIFGPIIYSVCQNNNLTWKSSSLFLAAIQFLIAVTLFFTLSFWDDNTSKKARNLVTANTNLIDNKKGVVSRVIYMFLFSGFDITITLWLATYITEKNYVSIKNIGYLVGVYYGSIMICRFLIGLFGNKVNLTKICDRALWLLFILTVLLFLVSNQVLLVIVISALGFSISPLHPFTLYENHLIYTNKIASKITSFQIAAGLLGSLCIPTIVGGLMSIYNADIFIYSEIIIVTIMILFRYKIIDRVKSK